MRLTDGLALLALASRLVVLGLGARSQVVCVELVDLVVRIQPLALVLIRLMRPLLVMVLDTGDRTSGCHRKWRHEAESAKVHSKLLVLKYSKLMKYKIKKRKNQHSNTYWVKHANIWVLVIKVGHHWSLMG